MRKAAANSNVRSTVARLRGVVLGRAEGAFLGSEDVLEKELGVSKPTIRQAARVLEREGLLRVKRGASGGYFGARPDVAFIEETVASYLEVLRARPEDLTRVATALWIETVRRAAALPAERTAGLASAFRRDFARLAPDAPFGEVQALEQKIRRAVFDLIDSPYVELIFNINASFARRRFATSPAGDWDSESHRAYVGDWRAAVSLELDAIAKGDVELAVLAAGRTRALMHRRLWVGDAVRDAQLAR
jgi:DNA-binding GntR family transcriptional regulator